MLIGITPSLLKYTQHIAMVYDIPGHVSPCNVLFIGNLVALITLILLKGLIYYTKSLATVSPKSYLLLFIYGSISTASVYFLYSAIVYLPIVQIVILERLDPVFYGIFAFLILSEKFNKPFIIAFIFTALAIATFMIFDNSPTNIKGLIDILIAVPCFAIRPILKKIILQHNPDLSAENVMFTTIFLSTIGFFFIALYFYGSGHFSDLFYPHLWGLIGVYALICVFLRKLIWNYAIAACSNHSILLSKYALPFLTIFFSLTLLREIPSSAESIAFVISVIALAISLKSHKKVVKDDSDSPQSQLNCTG